MLFLDFLNVTVLVNYGRENIGSIFSILDSIWTILKGNLSLVFKSTTAILSVLMGGGTAILNFFVNGVKIYFTINYGLLFTMWYWFLGSILDCTVLFISCQ